MRGTTSRRGPYVAPTPHVPTPDLLLNADGLAFSGGKLTTWTATHGPNAIATATCEPIEDAPTLNGKAGIVFPQSGGRAELVSAISAGTRAKHTFQAVIWPENAAGEGEREYLGYFKNGTTSSSDHMVFAHQANIVGYNKLGVFAGGSWYYIDAAPTHRPQVITYTFDSGVVRAYRNGSLLGSVTGANALLGYDQLNIGAAYGDVPVVQSFHGYMGDVRAWCGIALSGAQIDLEHDDRMGEFGIDPSEYYPSDSPSSITLWTDSRGKRGLSSGNFDGTASLTQWTDQSGNANHWLQGEETLYPSEGQRINGRPTIRTGASMRMATGALSTLLGQGVSKTYDIKIPLRIRSITSTEATAPHLRDVIFSDASGFLTLAAYTQGGSPKVSLYHYGGSSTTLTGDIALNTPTLLHAWYDGSTVGFRVGNATADTDTAANVSDLTFGTLLGKGFTTSGTADADIGETLIRNAYNSTIANNDRAYFGRVFNVAY